MKQIPLTQGKFAMVDDEDYDCLSNFKWYVRKHRNTFYAQRSYWEDGRVKVMQMHVQILGKKLGYQIDHVNGCGIDNQRENLRYVTNRQNGQNLHTNKSSKYPGVHWDKTRGKWKTEIQIKTDGRRFRKFLGRFDTEIEAFSKYKSAVEKLGEDTSLLESYAANI